MTYVQFFTIHRKYDAINTLICKRKTAGPSCCLYRQCNWQLIDFDKGGGADHYIHHHHHHQFVSSSDAVKNYQQHKNICTTLFKHIIQRKPHTASVHSSVREEFLLTIPVPALVWPAVWPLVRLTDEGHLMIFSFKENLSYVAMCSMRPQLLASWIRWQTVGCLIT